MAHINKPGIDDENIEKYVEMNIAHSFREGNRHSTRIWPDLILRTDISQVIDHGCYYKSYMSFRAEEL